MSYEFAFNASALGLGGVIEKGGRTTVIPSLASVALAPTGGEGSAVVENYCRDGIAFTRAESRVAGYKTGPQIYTTVSDIFITNLSVFGRVKVALLQGTVTSTRYPDQDDSEFELRAMYRGVEVDGEETIPAIDLALCTGAKYDDFARLVGANQAEAVAPPERIAAGIANRTVAIRGSLVSAIHRNDRSLVVQGSKLAVPGLGNVQFGELLVKMGRRRVNLLRFDFGATGSNDDTNEGPGDFSGSLTVASGDGNGIPVWPNG